MSFYTLRSNVKPSGLRVEHRFLSHPHTAEQAKRSIWARLTERLMTVKVDFSTDQRFIATPCSLLLNRGSIAKRGMFTSTQQPCRRRGVHQMRAGCVGAGEK